MSLSNGVYYKSKAWQLLDFMNKPSMGFSFCAFVVVVRVEEKSHTTYILGGT
jgi:hypothetical protein